MASISTNPAGLVRILFSPRDGTRKTLYLGRVTQRTARDILTRVERILESKAAQKPLDLDTAEWLGKIDDWLARRLANVGLILPRMKPGEKGPAVTLGEYLDQYIALRGDVKAGTRTNLEQARKKLVEYFGVEKRLADITAGDADEYRLHLLQQVSENTARRHCGRAKQFFRAALRKKIIRENPFGDMKGCGVKENRERFYFISREEAQRVLDHCPDAQWRLIFALARYGGLRTPSETLSLKWDHVDWERGRITIPSPKTAHFDGKQSRQIPLFPEIRPYLEEVWEQAGLGTDWIITRYRLHNINLRTQLERIIGRAGLTAWPKLFQNLRSTRETELTQEHPLHVVCSWLGNSPTVAAKHYLQVTDADFDRANKNNAKSNAVTTQNPTQQVTAGVSRNKQEKTKALASEGLVRTLANSCDSVRSVQVTPTGFEPVLQA